MNGDTSRRCKRETVPPSTVIVTCNEYGVKADGRLEGCGADVSCIATSAVKIPDKYSVPWSPPIASSLSENVTRAWRNVVNAVEDQEGLTIVERRDEDRYLRATAASVIPKGGIDDIEFLMKDQLPPTVLFRSATRQSVFIYPLTQPLDNQKSHAERLQQIRDRLGWEEDNLPGMKTGTISGGFKDSFGFGLFNPAPSSVDEEDIEFQKAIKSRR
jgi:hypothetical protein